MQPKRNLAEIFLQYNFECLKHIYFCKVKFIWSYSVFISYLLFFYLILFSIHLVCSSQFYFSVVYFHKGIVSKFYYYTQSMPRSCTNLSLFSSIKKQFIYLAKQNSNIFFFLLWHYSFIERETYIYLFVNGNGQLFIFTAGTRLSFNYNKLSILFSDLNLNQRSNMQHNTLHWFKYVSLQCAHFEYSTIIHIIIYFLKDFIFSFRDDIRIVQYIILWFVAHLRIINYLIKYQESN